MDIGTLSPHRALAPALALFALALLVLAVPLMVVAARRLVARAPLPRDSLRIVFLHPDLGIGGAERLIVDAAMALKARGHSVLVQTAHHDPSRCFEETRDGSLDVRVAGAVVPRHFAGRLHIVCASIRSLAGALCLIALEPAVDVVVVDQVAIAVPLLRFVGLPVLFYCHFPDKLLVTGAAAGAAGAAPNDPAAVGGAGARVKRSLKRLYRLPFDLLEELCTGTASDVLVNSAFTASVFDASFRVLRVTRGRLLAWPVPRVLHPAIDLRANPALPWAAPSACTTLVSINRFERKKDLALALDALCAYRQQVGGADAAALRLVLAGGWDARLVEQVEYYEELEELVERHGLADVVELRRNVSEEERRQLFEGCAAVVYTPSFEHFGIVPLEAMAAARPVVAVARGGPCESVVHGETGWLCEPTAAAFAAAFAEVQRLAQAGELRTRGAAARAHVERHFSLDGFGALLEEYVQGCVE